MYRKISPKILNLFFGAVTCVSLIFSIYVYNISNKYPEISYSSNTKSVYNHEIGVETSLIYKENRYDSGNLNKHTLTIWNSGSEQIFNDDVREEISIDINDGEIIDFTIEDIYPKYAVFEPKKSRNGLIMEFPYFDPNSYVVLNILTHTQKNSSDLKVSGYINGVSEFVDFCNNNRIFGLIVSIIIGIIAGVGMYIWLFSVVSNLENNYSELTVKNAKIIKISFLLLYIISFLIVIVTTVQIIDVFAFYVLEVTSNFEQKSEWMISKILEDPRVLEIISCSGNLG